MINNQLQVSVIICAYTLKRWKELQQAVQSIWEQTVLPTEIILVIDHNPALYSLALEAFPGVRVIENREEKGLSGARNCGVANCRGEVIAFMDEDATASPDWIETLLQGYTNPMIVGVGGNVKPAWDVEPPAWLPEEFYWVVGCSYKGLPQTPSPVRNPIGCNMSFRRETLIQSGGFRNGIGRVGTTPLGCEETELSIRIRQLYPSSVYLYQPNAVVFHKVPAWRVRFKYFLHRCYAEGLSKALVSRYVGAGDGLSSERRYVLATLSKGVLNGLAHVFSGRILAGIQQAAAIIIGFATTTAGFGVGTTLNLEAGAVPSFETIKQTQPAGAIFIGPYRQHRKEEVQSGTNSKSQQRSLE